LNAKTVAAMDLLSMTALKIPAAAKTPRMKRARLAMEEADSIENFLTIIQTAKYQCPSPHRPGGKEKEK
jgi:hypothetical protein